jgi:signal transduction histidine kinase
MERLPTGVKRLATNIYGAAGRVQELLTDLTSVIHGNRSTFAMCEFREIIAAVLEAASEALENKGVQLVLVYGIVLPLQSKSPMRPRCTCQTGKRQSSCWIGVVLAYCAWRAEGTYA